MYIRHLVVSDHSTKLQVRIHYLGILNSRKYLLSKSNFNLIIRSFKMKAQTLIVALLVSFAFANLVPTTRAMPKSNIICHICELIVSEIAFLLIEGNTIDQILDLVDDICQPFDNIVEGATAACEQFIETQLPVIVNELVHNQLSPYSVCQLLTACPSTRFEDLMLKH